MKALLEKGVSPNTINQIGGGETPLMYAMGKPHIECAKLLLEFGADVNIKANDGHTVLDDIKDKPEMLKLIESSKYKLQINFDETDPAYVCDEEGNYGIKIGKRISERTIRIRVRNTSKTQVIEGVKVMLTDIDKCESRDKGKLPVRLKLKNDHSPYQRSFTIPIDDYESFDVIQALFAVDKLKMYEFRICHIEQRDNYTEVPLQFNAENTVYTIKIEVKSNTTLCEPRWFKVGLKDCLIRMWSV